MGNFDFSDFYFTSTRLYVTLTKRKNSTRTCLKRRPLSFSIDSIVYPVVQSAAAYLFMPRWTRHKLRSLPSEDEIAEFLTKTERKKCSNTQKMLLDKFHLIFRQYLQERTSVYILKQCRETGKWGKSTSLSLRSCYAPGPRWITSSICIILHVILSFIQ